MSQGISFSGLGSGLDTDSIIEQLVAVERRPVQLIQSRQIRLEQQKGIVKEINSNLLSLKGTVDKLNSNDLFSIVNASANDANRVGVEAANEAAAGTFSIEVLNLAQPRSLSSRSFSSLSEDLNLNGELVINGKGIEISNTDDLIDIQDAINTANAGVSAQILTVDSGDSRLILSAEEVGEEGFDIKDASSTNLLQALGFTSGDTFAKNSFVNGARSAKFLDDSLAIGSLLSLGFPPSSTVTVGDKEIAVDLTVDSLSAIRDKINTAAPSGVSAEVVSSDEGGLTRYKLEISGTTDLIDSSGVLATLGVMDSDAKIADKIITGAESDQFNSTTTAIGSLLNLGNAPTGIVTIAGQNLDIDLAADSLATIQDKIDDLGIGAVTTSLESFSDEEGNAQFRLRIDGTTELADDGNVLETLGFVVGSNNSFESVAQVLTANVANKQVGGISHAVGSGAKTDQFNSDSDTVGSLISSSVAGTVSIGDKAVAINLATDSLTAVRDKINTVAPTGVSASINAVGLASFELQINGTTDFDDANGVLLALGVLDEPTTLTAATSFEDVLEADVGVGDTIAISGINNAGAQVSGSFTVSSGSQKIQSLLDTIEQTFGNGVTASVDSAGRIMVADNQSGSSSLSLSLQANNEGGGNFDLGALTETTQGLDARSAELQAGQNALFRINGISLSRSTNTVTDAVQGITLDLKEAEVGKLVDITVTKDDTTELRQTIGAFVTEFNSASDLINQQFMLDETTQRGGPLSGDATIINLQTRLRSAVSSQIDGLAQGFNALVLIGVSFDRSGHLTIDDNTLNNALSNNLEEVRKLFVAQGKIADEKVEYISSNSKTQVGNYGVKISSAPAKASLGSTVKLAGGLAADQTLTITNKATGVPAIIELQAGDTLDQIISQLNTELAGNVAEVRRGSIGNTTDGTAVIGVGTTFANVFGANVQDGDTIRINGTTHDGSSVSNTFLIDATDSRTVGDLLGEIRTTFNGAVSASVDSEGRIVVTDNQVGPSSLTVTLIEENEGGGSLNLGSIDVAEEGRFAHEITATNQDGELFLEHSGFGKRNGFSISQSLNQLGLAEGNYEGADVAGTINGEEAEGFGRILSGKIGSDAVGGLSLRVILTEEELAATGSERGSLNLIYGVARQLSDTLSSITDEFDGTLKNRENAINDTIDDMDDQIVNMERRIQLMRSNLVGKFASLEGSLATLQSEGNFLSSQLAGLAK